MNRPNPEARLLGGHYSVSAKPNFMKHLEYHSTLKQLKYWISMKKTIARRTTQPAQGL